MKIKQTIRLKKSELYGRFVKRILGDNASGILVDTRNGLFIINREDQGVGRDMLRNGGYGEDEVELISGMITSDSDVLIVGAHIGALAIPLAEQCKSLTAIEANPETFKLLRMNLALNESANCTALNIAASDKEQSIDFLLSKANSAGSKIVPKIKDWDYYYDKPQTISIPANRLDDTLDGKQFDLILMDIEGSEFFALQGMPNLLSNTKTLIVEFLPHHLKKVSGATVDQFLDLIEPHFDSLFIPSKNITTEKSQFRPTLQEMYDTDSEDNGIVFSKTT